MRSQALRSAALRVGMLRLLIGSFFFLLAGRAAWLTVVMVDDVRLHGDRQTHTKMSVAPARGLILDRDGDELAITLRAPSIYVVPQDLAHPEQDVASIAKALELDERELQRRILGRRGFRYVARWVSDDAAAAIEALDLDGVGIQKEPRRSYPSGSLASTVVGFSNIDGEGVRGVEQMMNDWLKGSAHTIAVQRDATGRRMSTESFDPRLANGGDVRLSIDSGLQAMAEAALAETVTETGAEGGLVIVLDPKTGDVLTLAEAPGFDPNAFRITDYATTRSRAFGDAMEPGSTFKALLVAAALDAGAIRPDQAFDTGDGSMRVPGKTIRDHDPYGVLDPAGILTHSSNIGAVMIGQALGPDRYYMALRAFGFGERSGSGFPDESAGILRSWRRWKPVDAATHSYGQGVAVTPMQLASAMAVLANDGRRMQPRLVVAQRAPGSEWATNEPVSRGQVVSPESARLTLDMMTGVVGPHGTGRLAGLRGLDVAGKTGTAQKIDPKTGRYSHRNYIAWFMAAVPANDPKLAIVVAIDEPKGARHSGGLIAAPVFARVATDHLADLGITTRPEPIAAAKVPILVADATPIAKPTTAANQKPPATPVRRERTRAVADSTPPTPVDALPAVSAKPPIAKPVTPKTAAASRPATNPGRAHAAPATPAVVDLANAPRATRDRPVLVPDFMGSEAGYATALAAQEDLDVRVVGDAGGQVIAQQPSPGTIITGADRTVRLTLVSLTAGGAHP